MGCQVSKGEKQNKIYFLGKNQQKERKLMYFVNRNSDELSKTRHFQKKNKLFQKLSINSSKKA